MLLAMKLPPALTPVAASPGGSVSVTASQLAPTPGTTLNVTTGAVGTLVFTLRVPVAWAGVAAGP